MLPPYSLPPLPSLTRLWVGTGQERLTLTMRKGHALERQRKAEKPPRITDCLGHSSPVGTSKPSTLRPGHGSGTHNSGMPLPEKDSESRLHPRSLHPFPVVSMWSTTDASRTPSLSLLPAAMGRGEAMRKLVNSFEDETGLWLQIVDTATLKRQAGLALKRPG